MLSDANEFVSKYFSRVGVVTYLSNNDTDFQINVIVLAKYGALFLVLKDLDRLDLTFALTKDNNTSSTQLAHVCTTEHSAGLSLYTWHGYSTNRQTCVPQKGGDLEGQKFDISPLGFDFQPSTCEFDEPQRVGTVFILIG